MTRDVASNYPFAKIMEIAESVPTGRVRATSDKSDKRQNFKFFIISRVRCSDKLSWAMLKGVNAQGATTRATSDKIVACRNNARMKLNFFFKYCRLSRQYLKIEISRKKKTFMTLVLFIFVNLVFFCPKMILCIKIEISRKKKLSWH